MTAWWGAIGTATGGLLAVLLALSVIIIGLLVADLRAWRRVHRSGERSRADFSFEAGAVLAEAAELCQSILPRLRAGQADAPCARDEFAVLSQAMRALSPAAPADPRILASANRGLAAMVHAGRLAGTADPQAVEAFIEAANIIWRERETLLRLARGR